MLEGDILVDFKMEARQDRDLVQIRNVICNPDVIVGLGYGTYSVLGYDTCKRVLYSLQFLMWVLGTTKSKEFQLSMHLLTIALATDLAVSQYRCL